MRKKEIRKLNRLLAGGNRPSVQEKEESLSAIVQRVSENETQGKRLQLSRFPFPAFAAASIMVLMVVGITLWFKPWNESTNTTGSEFIPRGTAEWGQLFVYKCINPVEKKAPNVCSVNDTLTFRVSPEKSGHFFSAAALNKDGTLVWYFPSGKVGSVRIDSNGIVKRGAVIKNNRPSDTWRLFGVISKKPLSKDEIRLAIEHLVSGKKTFMLIEEQSLKIEGPK